MESEKEREFFLTREEMMVKQRERDHLYKLMGKDSNTWDKLEALSRDSAVGESWGMNWQYSAEKSSSTRPFLLVKGNGGQEENRHNNKGIPGFKPIATADAFDHTAPKAPAFTQRGYTLESSNLHIRPHNLGLIPPYPLQAGHHKQEGRIFPASSQSLNNSLCKSHGVHGTGHPANHSIVKPFGGLNTSVQQSSLAASSISDPFAGLRSASPTVSKPVPSPAQLTIFYAGSVHVYNDVSFEKAQAIMLLAWNGNNSIPRNAQNANIAAASPPLSKPAMEVTQGNSMAPVTTTFSDSSPRSTNSRLQPPSLSIGGVHSSTNLTTLRSQPSVGLNLSILPADHSRQLQSNLGVYSVDLRLQSPSPVTLGDHHFAEPARILPPSINLSFHSADHARLHTPSGITPVNVSSAVGCSDDVMIIRGTTGLSKSIQIEPSKFPIGPPIATLTAKSVPQARKASLTRFLENRNQRSVKLAPYPVKKPDDHLQMDGRRGGGGGSEGSNGGGGSSSTSSQGAAEVGSSSGSGSGSGLAWLGSCSSIVVNAAQQQ